MYLVPLFVLILSSINSKTTTKRVTYESQNLDRLLEEDETGDTRFEFNVQTHNMYYKRISENLKAMENAYVQCLDSLSNNNYSEDTVESCVGKDMIYVINDIQYERKQIFGRADNKIRSYMIEYCYKTAEGDAGSNSCDVLERDILELLWNELNFGALIDYHRPKYITEVAQVPEGTFDKIINYLSTLYTELVELLDEIDDHSVISRANLKKEIDMRTRVILEQAHENARNPLPKIIKHTIEIEEKINNPNYIDVRNLPRSTYEDHSTAVYEGESNPDVDEFRAKYGDKLIEEDIKGPIITLPERRLKLDE